MVTRPGYARALQPEADDDMRTLNRGGATSGKPGFHEELGLQRWDDHRYYHHSRINQSLHLLSATSFIATYILLLVDPSFAVL
ncbi:MAG: hypothetical protein ACREO9_11660, partial [Lysobacterales bacterium]